MHDNIGVPDGVKLHVFAEKRHDDIVSAVVAVAIGIVERLVNITGEMNDEFERQVAVTLL